MRLAIVGILVLGCVRVAPAFDQPISGAKLILRRSNSGSRN